jgi:hypothetical protein
MPKPFSRPSDIGFDKLHAALPFALLWPPEAQPSFTFLVAVNVRGTLPPGLNDEVRLDDIHLRRLGVARHDKQAFVQWRVLGWRDFEAIPKLLSLHTGQPRPGQFQTLEFKCLLLEGLVRFIAVHGSCTVEVMRARLDGERASRRGEQRGSPSDTRRFLAL